VAVLSHISVCEVPTLEPVDTVVVQFQHDLTSLVQENSKQVAASNNSVFFMFSFFYVIDKV
jgi:hypothetical protein